MIIVKSVFGKIEFDNSAITGIQDVTDGLYIRTKDGSEFRVASEALPQLKVLPQMVMNLGKTNTSITVDLTKPANPISVS